jgi:hypothetical protein
MRSGTVKKWNEQTMSRAYAANVFAAIGVSVILVGLALKGTQMPIEPVDLNRAGCDIVRATSSHIELLAPLFDAYRQFNGQNSDVQAANEFLPERLNNGQSVVFLALDDTIMTFVNVEDRNKRTA